MINIRDILKEKGYEIHSVPPDSTVYESLEKMSARNVGAMLVMSDEKLLGVITERDYMKKIILKDRSSKTVISTGTIDPACEEVRSLYSLQKPIIFTPCCPKAGPTGGAGFACPAGTYNFI